MTKTFKNLLVLVVALVLMVSLTGCGFASKAEKVEREEEKDCFVRRERSSSCSRTFYVGDAITEDDIKAKYVNGTLILDVPKKEKALPEKKTIQID